MISALHLLSYLAGAAGFLFVLLSLASGLLYVAEVIEEHSGLAKTVGKRTIYVIMVLHVIFYFTDALPLHIVGLGVFCHFVYLQNFSKSWPSISLLSPAFLLSCILVVLSHFLSFSYFSERSHNMSRHHYGSYGANKRTGSWGSTHDNQNRWGGGAGGGNSGYEDTFLDVATYFGVCVWLVPFFLFLSLSANDNVLPTESVPNTPQVGMNSPNPSGHHQKHPSLSSSSTSHNRKQSSLLKNALSSGLSLFLRRGRGNNQREGLIASPSRSRPTSPLFPPTGSPYSPNLNASPRAGGGGGGNLWGNSAPSSPNPGSYSPSMGSGGGGGLFGQNSSSSENFMSRKPSNGLGYPPGGPGGSPRLSMPPRRATDLGLSPPGPAPPSPNFGGGGGGGGGGSPRFNTPPPPPRRPSMLALNEEFEKGINGNGGRKSPPLAAAISLSSGGGGGGGGATSSASGAVGQGLTKRKVG